MPLLRRTALFCLVLVVVAAAGQPALAQARRAMTIVDLIEVPRAFDPQLSADGAQIAFTFDRPDWKANRRITHLWRIDASGSNLVQLTQGENGESSPRWSPDGSVIAFLTRRGDNQDTQVYLLPTGGGEARQLSKHATAVSAITWAPDGEALYFLAPDPKTDVEKEQEKLKDDVFAYDENYKQQHLWKVAVKDGTEQRITSGAFSVMAYKLSHDGKKIAHHRCPTPHYGDNLKGEVWLMDAGGANAVQLTTNTVEEGGAELSPDGTQVLFLTGSNQQFEPYYNSTLFLVPAAGGQPRILIPDFPYDIQNAMWAADARSIYLVVNMGVHSELFQVDVRTAKPRQVTDGRHAIQGGAYVPSLDRFVFQFDEPTRPGDIWTMAPGGGATPARVTDLYGYLDRDFKLPRQEKISYAGADGVMVEGLVYYPIDYVPGQRYALCVQTHGGPQSSDKFGWQGPSTYVPVLTAKGYAVFKPNYRGSTGYGNTFLRDMVLHYFKNAHLDVMAGVDYLIKIGVADPDRLVKMGWSAGGHMTNKIITFTTRFKAASSGAGASNWISMYAQSDVRTYRTPWFGGTPWQKNAPTDVYWEHSPLKYISSVTTPTLFLVGQNDVRVPPPQSVEMYRALVSNGIPTHLYMAPREPHGWGELRHVLFKANVELDWFEKWAMGRTYTWEKAPGSDKK